MSDSTPRLTLSNWYKHIHGVVHVTSLQEKMTVEVECIQQWGSTHLPSFTVTINFCRICVIVWSLKSHIKFKILAVFSPSTLTSKLSKNIECFSTYRPNLVEMNNSYLKQRNRWSWFAQLVEMLKSHFEGIAIVINFYISSFSYFTHFRAV